jgi:hypothetical protein
MEFTVTLTKQGFSVEEIKEMERMTSAISWFLSEKNPTLNWKQVAIFEADSLVYFTKSEKVRDFATKVQNKLKQFS